MAVLSTQPISRAGLAATYAAASAGGDKFTPGDHVVLHVKNGSAGSVTVTVVTPGLVDGLAIADVSKAIAAGAEAFIGPLPADLFRDSDDGYGDVTYSASASVTVAVLAA
jgi:hypothetical protein